MPAQNTQRARARFSGCKPPPHALLQLLGMGRTLAAVRDSMGWSCRCVNSLLTNAASLPWAQADTRTQRAPEQQLRPTSKHGSVAHGKQALGPVPDPGGRQLWR